MYPVDGLPSRTPDVLLCGVYDGDADAAALVDEGEACPCAVGVDPAAVVLLGVDDAGAPVAAADVGAPLGEPVFDD